MTTKTFCSAAFLFTVAPVLAASETTNWKAIPDSELQSLLIREASVTYDFEQTEFKERIVRRLVSLKDSGALQEFWKDQASLPVDIPGLQARIQAADFLLKDPSTRDLARQLLEQVVDANDDAVLSASITPDRIKTYQAPLPREAANPFPPERKAKMVQEAIVRQKDRVISDLPLIRVTASTRLAKIIRETEGIKALIEAAKKYSSVEDVGPYFQEYLAKVVASDK